MLEARDLVKLTAASLAINAAFYLVFRSGLNLLLRDPSLTLWMILASTLVLLYAISATNGGRSTLLLVYLVPFLFGLFRLSTTKMLAIAAFFLAA